MYVSVLRPFHHILKFSVSRISSNLIVSDGTHIRSNHLSLCGPDWYFDLSVYWWLWNDRDMLWVGVSCSQFKCNTIVGVAGSCTVSIIEFDAHTESFRMNHMKDLSAANRTQA